MRKSPPRKTPPPKVDTSTDPSVSQPIDASTGEVHDADGLLIDAYSDDTFQAQDTIDALDVPLALSSERLLEDVSDDTDGTSEIDAPVRSALMDTVDTGARQRPSDDGEMGLGAEPHPADDLQRASIAGALKGRAGVTRDDEVHGERLFDSPVAA